MKTIFGLIRDMLAGFNTLSEKLQENKPTVEKVVEAVAVQQAVDRYAEVGKNRVSKQGYLEVASYEGLSNSLYLDSVNVRTVGIGMTVSEVKDINTWSWDRIIPTQEAVQLFVASLDKYADAVNKALKVRVNQAQFDALVSITYNIGIGAMQKSTFMRRLNADGSYTSVAEALTWFDRAGGKVLKGLQNRRAAESKLFLTGKYSNDGTVAHIKVNSAHKPVYDKRINIEQYL